MLIARRDRMDLALHRRLPPDIAPITAAGTQIQTRGGGVVRPERPAKPQAGRSVCVGRAVLTLSAGLGCAEPVL